MRARPFRRKGAWLRLEVAFLASRQPLKPCLIRWRIAMTPLVRFIGRECSFAETSGEHQLS